MSAIQSIILQSRKNFRKYSAWSTIIWIRKVFLFLILIHVYKYEEILGDRTIAENREECSFIWDNYYYEDEKINEYDLSLFIETDKDSGLYRKYEETHYQRAYTLEEMKELIRKSGLEFVTAYDAFSKNAPMDTSERIYVIAREQGK